MDEQAKLQQQWVENKVDDHGIIQFDVTQDEDFEIAIGESYTIAHCTKPNPKVEGTREIAFRWDDHRYTEERILKILRWYLNRAARVHNIVVKIYPSNTKRDVYQRVELFSGITVHGEYIAE